MSAESLFSRSRRVLPGQVALPEPWALRSLIGPGRRYLSFIGYYRCHLRPASTSAGDPDHHFQPGAAS
jgi:hypothetical protein